MKQKTHSGAKKRVKRTGTGKFVVEKAAHKHRLNPKNKRQKNLAGRKRVLSDADSPLFKKLLHN